MGLLLESRVYSVNLSVNLILRQCCTALIIITLQCTLQSFSVMLLTLSLLLRIALIFEVFHDYIQLFAVFFSSSMKTVIELLIGNILHFKSLWVVCLHL